MNFNIMVIMVKDTFLICSFLGSSYDMIRKEF